MDFRDLLKVTPNLAAKRTTILAAIAVSFVCTAQLAAAEYTVQIGALKNANHAFITAASDLGEVTTRINEAGLTLYQVGHFATRQEAATFRQRVVKAGFVDAFVKATDFTPSQPVPGPMDLSALTPAQRNKVVVLDGKLHLKEGDAFVPLSQIVDR